MTPDVSVIIPVYNGEAFIEGTLRSILGQEGVGVQVVVSDDGSSDRTWSLVEGLRDDRVTLVRNRGKGVPAGLNTCLQFVAAPVVCRSDHDDYYTPGRLARQLEILRARPEMGAVCGAVEALTHDGEVVADLGSGDAAEEITGELRSGKLRTHFNTWAMRTELVRSLKGFRDFGLSGEDNDMQLRAGDASRVWYDPRVCYQWRLHATSITHRQPTVERVWAERLSYVLQEQRRSRGGPDDMDLGRPLPPPPPDLKPAPPPRVRDQIADILIGSSWQMLARGRRLAAVRQARRAVAYRADRASIRNLAAVLAKLG